MAAIPSTGSLIATHDYYRRRIGSTSSNSSCGSAEYSGEVIPHHPGLPRQDSGHNGSDSQKNGVYSSVKAVIWGGLRRRRQQPPLRRPPRPRPAQRPAAGRRTHIVLHQEMESPAGMLPAPPLFVCLYIYIEKDIYYIFYLDQKQSNILKLISTFYTVHFAGK
uniref:Pancreatic progenitor cell differentiation and proliferation factor a n=1 Tax=Gadus morhua TaxID=8049 RepID=A0A8C5B863_GADMO